MAEQAVKKEIADEGWRLAFSRPGFVTCKHDESRSLPEGVFIRAASRSIGKCHDNNAKQQIAKLIESLETSPLARKPFDQLHVWPKDRAAIGRFGFEPGIDEVAGAVAQEVYETLSPEWVRSDAPNRIAMPDETVLDIVLIEPAYWFYGIHTRHPNGQHVGRAAFNRYRRISSRSHAPISRRPKRSHGAVSICSQTTWPLKSEVLPVEHAVAC